MAAVQTVHTHDFDMRCAVLGRGEKNFVIIPGVSIGHVTDFAPALERRYKPYLKEFTVTMIDRREDIPEGYTMAQMAEDTVLVMEELGLRDIRLFGASQGGMLAIHIAENHPALVRRLLLGSTASTLPPLFSERCRHWLELVDRADSRGLFETFVDWMFSESFLAENRENLIRFAPTYSAEELCRFRRLVEAFYTLDIDKDLGKITCPAMVLGAEKDIVLTAEASRHLADVLGCEQYIYPGMGHAVYDEAPDYTERQIRFLR